tara:strand:- start:1657 stop:1926 length:270 start_codon:yes stop_codon:yes gene_type:complete
VYLTSDLPKEGYYDSESQYQYIYPESDWVEDEKIGLLIIGAAGCDGVLFGLKKDDRKIWVHYPINNEARLIADSYIEFISGWRAGSLKV